jgi:hypothetical protein
MHLDILNKRLRCANIQQDAGLGPAHHRAAREEGARLKRIGMIAALAAAACFGCAQEGQMAPSAGAPTLVNPAAVETEQLRRAMQGDQEKRYQQQQADAYDRKQCLSEGLAEFSADYGQCRTRLSLQRKGIGGINPTPAGGGCRSIEVADGIWDTRCN